LQDNFFQDGFLRIYVQGDKDLIDINGKILFKNLKGIK